jgi:CheY-like chemotaxis protein
MKKVLLIEDDDIFVHLHVRILQINGIAEVIHTAWNGRQALDFIKKYYHENSSLPDAILLDLSMPEMDGFSFLEEYKKLTIPDTDKVKIIVITSSVNIKDMERVKSFGIKDYLIKPVPLDKLKAALA